MSDLAYSAKDILLDNEGRYQNIRISVQNNVKQNPLLIQNIMKAIGEFDRILSSVTRRQASGTQTARIGLSIGNVSISLPASWKGDNDDCQKPDIFCPEETNAHFIIKQSEERTSDEPHTIQYGKCGESGKSIIFTSDYFIDEAATENKFGGYGRSILLHWARLRWGVFREDRMINGDYFYLRPDIEGTGRVSAVMCTENIFGQVGVPLSNGSIRRCRRGNTADRKLPEKACRFIPHSHENNASASLMYSSVVKSINVFCDMSDNMKTRHNFASPSEHNELCSYRSVTDVIKEHSDFKVSLPENIISPSIPHLEIKHREPQMLSRTVVLVLDISSSMAGKSIELLRITGAHIVENVIESSAMLGVIAFESRTTIVQPLQLMDSASIRTTFANSIRNLVPRGLTALSDGVVAGIECGGCSYNNLTHRVYNCNKTIEIILLTDGAENTGTVRIENLIANLADQNVIVQSILFGQSSDRRVIQLAKLTGGRAVISEPANPLDDLLKEMTAIIEIKMAPFQKVIEVVREKLNFDPQQITTKTFTINERINKNLFLFLTLEQGQRINLELIGPQNQFINKSDVANYEFIYQLNAIRIRMPTMNTQGNWILRLIPSTTMKYLTNPTSSLASLYISGLLSLPKKDMTDEENIIFKGEVSPSTLNVTSSTSEVIVTAMLIQNSQPLILKNPVKVLATVELRTLFLIKFELRDDGTGGDILAGDGVFSGCIPPSVLSSNGFYAIHVTLQEQGEGGLYRSVSLDTLEVRLSSTNPSAAPPGRVTDLRAEANATNGGTIRLQWTAPGAELFSGTVTSYELRFSNKLRFDFNDALQVPRMIWNSNSNLSAAGLTQEITFNANDAELMKAGPLLNTTYCFQLKAFNSKGGSSVASNTATIMFEDPVNLKDMVSETPATRPPTKKPIEPISNQKNVAGMIVGICVAVLVVSMGIAAGLLYLKKYARKSKVIPVA